MAHTSSRPLREMMINLDDPQHVISAQQHFTHLFTASTGIPAQKVTEEYARDIGAKFETFVLHAQHMADEEWQLKDDYFEPVTIDAWTQRANLAVSKDEEEAMAKHAALKAASQIPATVPNPPSPISSPSVSPPPKVIRDSPILLSQESVDLPGNQAQFQQERDYKLKKQQELQQQQQQQQLQQQLQKEGQKAIPQLNQEQEYRLDSNLELQKSKPKEGLGFDAKSTRGERTPSPIQNLIILDDSPPGTVPPRQHGDDTAPNKRRHSNSPSAAQKLKRTKEVSNDEPLISIPDSSGQDDAPLDYTHVGVLSVDDGIINGEEEEDDDDEMETTTQVIVYRSIKETDEKFAGSDEKLKQAMMSQNVERVMDKLWALKWKSVREARTDSPRRRIHRRLGRGSSAHPAKDPVRAMSEDSAASAADDLTVLPLTPDSSSLATSGKKTIALTVSPLARLPPAEKWPCLPRNLANQEKRDDLVRLSEAVAVMPVGLAEIPEA